MPLQLREDMIAKLIEESLFKYQALFDSNMIGIASTDFQDRILKANDAFLTMIGYSREELESGKLRWSTITPKQYDGADTDKISELSLHKRIVPFEKEYIHKDGHTVPVLVGAELLDEALSVGVCFALDISELKELERKKDDFIGTVSHELKTPLSVMKLYSDFLRNSIEHGASKEEMMESAREISAQVDKLSILITDLLNMARYQTNEPPFALTAINLLDCAKDVVNELSLVSERNIIFQGERAVFVTGNQARLSQVITNLVNNACKYSEPETDIIVHVHKDDKNGYVRVQDFGKGIDPADQQKIFQRYYRIDHANDYNDGAGIGLYISHEIVKRHGGVLTVESELGKGSTFTIAIPVA